MKRGIEKKSKDLGAESTRERILSTATSLFSRKGYDSTSIRDITEAAGVNVAAVNYHFGSKENLYLEVLKTRAEALRVLRAKAIGEAVCHAQNPAAALEAGIGAFVKSHFMALVSGGPGEEDMNLFFRETSSPGIGWEIVQKELVEPTRKNLVALILKAKPGFDQKSAGLCVSSLMGQLLHFARARKLMESQLGRGYDAETVEFITDHIIAFTLGGLKALGTKSK